MIQPSNIITKIENIICDPKKHKQIQNINTTLPKIINLDFFHTSSLCLIEEKLNELIKSHNQILKKLNK